MPQTPNPPPIRRGTTLAEGVDGTSQIDIPVLYGPLSPSSTVTAAFGFVASSGPTGGHWHSREQAPTEIRRVLPSFATPVMKSTRQRNGLRREADGQRRTGSPSPIYTSARLAALFRLQDRARRKDVRARRTGGPAFSGVLLVEGPGPSHRRWTARMQTCLSQVARCLQPTPREAQPRPGEPLPSETGPVSQRGLAEARRRPRVERWFCAMSTASVPVRAEPHQAPRVLAERMAIGRPSSQVSGEHLPSSVSLAQGAERVRAPRLPGDSEIPDGADIAEAEQSESAGRVHRCVPDHRGESTQGLEGDSVLPGQSRKRVHLRHSDETDKTRGPAGPDAFL